MLGRSSFIALLILMSVPSNSFSTTGGPEVIKVIGYDGTDHRIYWLTYYQDGSGRLPQVFYIDFSNSRPSKAIAEESLYEGLGLTDTKTFYARIGAFRKRQLVRLEASESDTVDLTVRIISTREHSASDLPVPEYEMEVTLRNGSRSGTQIVTGYINRRIPFDCQCMGAGINGACGSACLIVGP